MSRVTVEDCLDKVNGYFELTHLASKRAVQLSNGTPSVIEAELGAKKEKVAVTALREIAEGKINKDNIEQEKDTQIDQKLPVSVWIRAAREKSEQYEEETF